ncbi:MAG: hypothetical protein QNJ72_05500 [Pleurocapsa sp. MO_226.B13]|nr:hypothetical protein [Pleurocapsa sp. MO_226.B13]
MIATTNNGKFTTTTRSDIFQILLQDEDGQNILSIDDGSLRQSLSIEIVNTSGRTIEFQSIDDRLSLNNYHFCISFRPGTLLSNSGEDREITLKEKEEGWQIIEQNNTFYLLSSNPEPRTIENGARITLTLENIGAAPEGGARGTRVEIKYNYLQYQGSSEPISGNKLQYLNIVNQRGKKQVPLYAGFLGSNTILNDGTENELTLTIQSLPNQSVSLTVLESPEITKVNTTRWDGNLLKFVREKIPNFVQAIEEIQQNPNISDATKQFFTLLQTSIESNDSFQNLQGKLENSNSTLQLKDADKQEIVTILIANLGIVSQDDLNAITSKLNKLLSLELTHIEAIIKRSPILQVIKFELNKKGSLNLRGVVDSESTLDQAAKFTISFDVETTENHTQHWALVEKTDADDIQIIIEYGQDNWVFGGKEKQGITPRWSFICQSKEGLELKDREEILRLNISNLKTQLLSGYANLYVHYENIPGYWDGYINVPIHKGPLVYREYKTSDNVKIGCVGIGTDEPQAKLHIKNTDQDANGNTLILGPTNQSNLRLGYHQNYSWIQSHGNKPLAINSISNNVGIGTTAPGDNKLKVKGNTAIAGNLSVTNGRLGIGSSNLSKEPLVIRAQGKQEGLIAFEDPNGKKKWHIEQNYGGNTPGLNFVETDVADFRLFIQQGGNIGIGTKNIGSNKLKVEGNAEIVNDLKVNGTTSTQTLRVDGLNRSSHLNVDGAIYRKSGQVYLTVDDNFYIRDSGGTDDNVKMHFNTNNGTLKVQNIQVETKPIILKRYTNLGDSIRYNTNYSANEYSAAIVGFRALNGDINEKGAQNLVQVYMYVNQGKWYIRADIATHNHNETWYVDVMFVSNKLARREGSW